MLVSARGCGMGALLVENCGNGEAVCECLGT